MATLKRCVPLLMVIAVCVACTTRPDKAHWFPSHETVLSLSEARQAHELSQTGHARGKIIV